MLEAIIEELVGLVLEGMIEGSTNSRVPKPVRWVLRVIVFAVYAALIGILLLVTVAGFRNGNTGIAIFTLVLSILLCVMFVIKTINRKKGR